MMRAGERLLLVTCLTAVGTIALGWWAVPILVAVWAWFDRDAARPAAVAALGAGIGWTLLLARDVLHGHLFAFAAAVGGIMHLPGWALLLVTVAFGAALAACAASLAHRARRSFAGESHLAAGRPPR